MVNKKWYMITTISGREEKVIESIQNRIVSEGLENSFGDIKLEWNLFFQDIFLSKWKWLIKHDLWFVILNMLLV